MSTQLRITGAGCVTSIRQLTSDAGKSFVGCQILAFTGGALRPIEVTAVGEPAQTLIRECEQAVAGGHNVQIGFHLDDIWTKIFTPRMGEHAGKPVAPLKSRLVAVIWVRIDGLLTYTAECTD